MSSAVSKIFDLACDLTINLSFRVILEALQLTKRHSLLNSKRFGRWVSLLLVMMFTDANCLCLEKKRNKTAKSSAKRPRGKSKSLCLILLHFVSFYLI
jgi:hypothetical protein